MKRKSHLLVYIILIGMSASCKRTYQCSCPTLGMGQAAYVFDVKAISYNKAQQECINAGKKDKIVYQPEVELCSVFSHSNK